MQTIILLSSMYVAIFNLQEIMMFKLVRHCFKIMTTNANRKLLKNRQIWHISYITSRKQKKSG